VAETGVSTERTAPSSPGADGADSGTLRAAQHHMGGWTQVVVSAFSLQTFAEAVDLGSPPASPRRLVSTAQAPPMVYE
jgi:hypothetical protein